MKIPLGINEVMVLATVFAVVSGCKSDAEKKESDTETDTSPGDKEDAAVPEDSESDTKGGEGDPCETFHDFLVECGMAPLGVVYIDGFCNAFDEIFIDSYMNSLTPCMAEVGCDGFGELLQADTDSGSQGANVMTQCATEALNEAEPEEANKEFQQHFCDYATQCDENLTEEACLDTFEEEDEMMLFMVLDEPYISDADDCVHPMPECSEEVTECINEVVGQIRTLLDDLQ